MYPCGDDGVVLGVEELRTSTGNMFAIASVVLIIARSRDVVVRRVRMRIVDVEAMVLLLYCVTGRLSTVDVALVLVRDGSTSADAAPVLVTTTPCS
jgi:hypothetical protein